MLAYSAGGLAAETVRHYASIGLALEPLLQRVARTVERHRMFSSGQKVGVAVSGGADSVCLLFALRELAPHFGILLSVLHLDHGLRGDESTADAEFVRSLADQLGLAAIVERADPRMCPGNLEQAARRARLEFFRRQIAAGLADRVAVGHTRSDQAETVLFRFLRGAATAGLAGIRPVTSTGIVRPLLEVDRGEAEAFLQSRSLCWRQDSTNRSMEFARNRIRHILLPELARAWNPAIARTLAHTADWALAEETFWQGEIERHAASLFHRDGSAVLVRAGALTDLPLAAARRLVRRAIELTKGNLRGLDFAHIAEVLEIAGSPIGRGRAAVPGVRILRSFDWLRFSPAEEPAASHAGYALPLSVPSVVELPGSSAPISLELIDKPETTLWAPHVYNREMGCIDWPRISGPLELRNWRPGDKYQPMGHAGEEKIKRLFQLARIPVWERSGWPVLTDRTGIVWTRRFGPAAAVAPNSSTRTMLRIREIVKLESETPQSTSIKLG